jgi:hypothetical protein
MQQLMGTVGKYVNVPHTAKFTQEKQNGNRLRREIAPIKHRTLCLPEILELEAVSKNTQKFGDDTTPRYRKKHFPLYLPAVKFPSPPVIAIRLDGGRVGGLISREVVSTSHCSQQVA